MNLSSTELDRAVPRYAAAIGLVGMLYEQMPARPDLSLESFLKAVGVPFRLRQIKIYTAEEGRPLGYFSWAWTTAATLERLRTESIFALHISEWREGPHLVIADLVAANGVLARIIDDITNHLFKDEFHIFWPSRRPIKGRLRVWRREIDGTST